MQASKTQITETTREAILQMFHTLPLDIQDKYKQVQQEILEAKTTVEIYQAIKSVYHLMDSKKFFQDRLTK
ncbi:hypothetical protein SKB0120_17630 [Moraxella osloensis]|jgi:alkyl sulfatase BDS1-like metallo-beta-lactamase superfamily hydrolase